MRFVLWIYWKQWHEKVEKSYTDADYFENTVFENCILYVVAMDYQSSAVVQLSAVLAKTKVCLVIRLFRRVLYLLDSLNLWN